MDTKHEHSKIIDDLGGTFAVAEMCEVKPPSVSDWRKTGIPRARLLYLKAVHPDIFREPPVEEKAA